MTDADDERPGEGAAPNRRSVLRTTDTGSVTASRRGVVAGAVASVAAALGLTGGAAAAGADAGRAARWRRVEQRYADENVARETLQDRGADVLALLADEGLLERGDVAELGAPHVSAAEVDGTIAGHLTAETEVDDGTLTVVVQPEADRQYATVTHDDGTATVFDPANDEVTPNCWVATGCEGPGCDCTLYELVACRNGDCYKNGVRGECNDCINCLSPACGY